MQIIENVFFRNKAIFGTSKKQNNHRSDPTSVFAGCAMH
jgi:hypothetical protein